MEGDLFQVTVTSGAKILAVFPLPFIGADPGLKRAINRNPLAHPLIVP